MTAPEPLEADLQAACARALDALLLPPATWACYPAGAAALSPQQQARYSRLGLKRGWPDLLILANGGIWGIELKRYGMALSKTRIVRTARGSPRILDGQADVFPRLIAAGFRDIAIARSVDQMLEQLQRWGVATRQTGSRIASEARGMPNPLRKLSGGAVNPSRPLSGLPRGFLRRDADPQ